MKNRSAELDTGDVEAILSVLFEVSQTLAPAVEMAAQAVAYFRNNRHACVMSIIASRAFVPAVGL